MANKLPSDDQKPFLCENCFTAPQLPSRRLCNGCWQMFKLRYVELDVLESNIRAARIRQAPVRRRKLLAYPEAPVKRRHPYEVSFVVSSGMRVAEGFHRIENAKARFHELKLDNVCGLRLSENANGRIQELYSHRGTFRPVVRRTDDIAS